MKRKAFRLRMCILSLFLGYLVGCQEQTDIEIVEKESFKNTRISTTEWNEQLWQNLQKDTSFNKLKEIARKTSQVKNVYMQTKGSDSIMQQMKKELLYDLKQSIYCNKLLRKNHPEYSVQYIRKFISDSLLNNAVSKIILPPVVAGGDCEYAMNHYRDMLFYLSYMLDSFVMIYEVLYVDAEEPIRDYIRSETDYYDLWDNQDFWDKIYEDQTYLMSITCESVSEIIESYITPARTLLTYAKEDLYHIMNSFQADPYSYFEESHGGGYTEITPGTCTHEKCQICGGCLDKSTIACEPCTCPSLTLTVSSSTVTINESVTLTTTSVAENTACTFQIRGDSIQEDIAYVNGTSYTFTPRVSGVFWLRVKQSFYGRDFYSDEVKLEVQYPSYDDIVSDSSVIQKMEILWSSTKYSTTPITVKEYGCWIYWDSQTASYDFQIVEGEAVSPPLVPSVSTPNTTLTRTVDALVGTEKTLVAIFHTHTPLTYYDGNHIRLVGPSSNDLEAIKNDNVVGIVYDYVGENGELKSGHNINDSAKLYHFGEERRPTRTKFY